MGIDRIRSNIIGFVVLILLQILIFNNIGISNLGIVPMFFLLYIVMLPFETPKWLLLVSAFFIGLIIDIFSDTSGLNASATVFIAFFRPFLLQNIAPRGGYDTGSSPSIVTMGFSWFLKYAAIIVFIHQLVYYLLENFGFNHFFYLLIKVLIGTFFSLLFIVITQFIVYRK